MSSNVRSVTAAIISFDETIHWFWMECVLVRTKIMLYVLNNLENQQMNCNSEMYSMVMKWQCNCNFNSNQLNLIYCPQLHNMWSDSYLMRTSFRQTAIWKLFNDVCQNKNSNKYLFFFDTLLDMEETILWIWFIELILFTVNF